MRRLSLLSAIVAVATSLIPWAAANPTQETIVVSGTDVRPPKRTKSVAPEYPVEAQAQGIRGIVIVEILIDPAGKVADVKLLRSIPGLDEAAVTAVKQWQYEPTKVDGKPVTVRHTVPITFALKLPQVERQAGVPDLRAGVAPKFPEGADRSQKASVSVSLTLDAQGRVADAEVTSGDPPFAQVMLRTLDTWRFAPDPEGATVACKLVAEFQPGDSPASDRVSLRLSSPQRSQSLAEASAPASPVPSTAPAEQASPSIQAAAAAPDPSPMPASPSPSPEPAPQTPSDDKKPKAPEPPAGGPATPTPPSGTAARPASSVPVEVLTPSTAVAPIENGVSSIREVRLEKGVPDLVSGRRPVVPPLARIARAEGEVTVEFSVDAGGKTAVGHVEGPDLLKPAAQQTVQSWSFRRTSPERLRLAAAFVYKGNDASATVKPVQ